MNFDWKAAIELTISNYQLKSVHYVHMVHWVHRPQKSKYQLAIINYQVVS